MADKAGWFSKMAQMLKQYGQDAMPGGALNPEVTPQSVRMAAELASMTPNPIGDIASIGLAADDLRQGNYGDAALNAVGVLPFVPAMGAMTAWHGSPHKFDKFSLDKIGTGEGAQAYGHGLYLAESPEVAMGYRDKLQQVAYSGNKIDPSNPAHVAVAALERYGDKEKASQYLKKQAGLMDYEINTQAAKLLDSGGELPNRVANGQLYKTDIPDEAVARFLDWDKPLSQQAPEVLAAMGYHNQPRDLAAEAKAVYGTPEYAQLEKLMDTRVGSARVPDVTGAEWYRSTDELLRGSNAEDAARSEYLRSIGIPGIRYLDGGSRSAGQGSSNFVAFDPEMIRILERNGQATGQQPWKPGEWK